jgi:hypothetical protein
MVLYFCKESQNYFNSFATLVSIGALRWYRFVRYSGTDSCAMMVPFRRYYQDLWIKYVVHWDLCGMH